MKEASKGYLLVAGACVVAALSVLGLLEDKGPWAGVGAVLVVLLAVWLRKQMEWTEEGDRKIQRMAKEGEERYRLQQKERQSREP